MAREHDDAKLLAQTLADLERASPGDPLTTCELGRAYEWTGRLTEARTQLETCVGLDPNPQNQYRLALLYQKLGLPELAQKTLERREEGMKKMSEETAIGMNALQSFK